VEIVTVLFEFEQSLSDEQPIARQNDDAGAE
jgi:hypothetical protein